MPDRVTTIIDQLTPPAGRASIEQTARLSGFAHVQRQALDAGQTCEIGDEECAIVHGRFRLDGRLILTGSGSLFFA